MGLFRYFLVESLIDVKNLVKTALIFTLTISPPITSFAATNNLPITPDGTTNTQIDSAANEVPIVNIAAPNSGGLSHNKFRDYNVNPSGLVLNNATNNPNQVIRTDLAGLIMDNPNLINSGAARVILNEVTSTNRSILNGYTEIGGRRADLIIANPNGIEMNSAGFINVSRLTAVVGSSKQFNPNPSDLSFDLSGNKNSGNGFLPKLTISGLGLDVTRVAETNLVANVMEIVSPIYGGDNEVGLRAGDREFIYETKEVTSTSENSGTNQPEEIAIDASNVANIQAGQIYIIATKEGFGVKYTGDMLASRGGVTIDAKGDVVYNNIASESGGISVKTTNGNITTTGVTDSRGINNDIKLEASNDINNDGQIIGARDIKIKTGNLFINKGIVLSDRDFIINANQIDNLGNLSSVNNIDILASILNNSNEIVANNNINFVGSQITNDDSIIAGKAINITATEFLNNNNDILSLVQNLTDENNNSLDAITINTLILNNNKRIAANSILTINANSLNNNTANSLIISGGDTNLNITNLDNESGVIESKNNLKIRNLATNNADIALLLAVTGTETSIIHSGNLKASNSIDINLGSSDYNIIGKLESDGFINIEANKIINKADIGAIDFIKIVANDDFTNGFEVAKTDVVEEQGANNDNSNIKIATNSYLDINSNNDINNYATLSAKTILSLKSLNGNINNYDGAELIASNQDSPRTSQLILEAINGAINQYSPNSVVVNGDHIIAANDYTNTGRIDISGSLTMNIANNLINDVGALIYAGYNMFLNIGNNLTNKKNATIYAENDLTIRKYDPSNPNYDATNNRINKLDNISAEIISYAGNINISANIINNKRESIYTQQVRKWLDDFCPCEHEYHFDLHEQGSYSGVITKEAKIYAGNNININSDYSISDLSLTSLTNQSSSIIAANDININIGKLNNNSNSFKSYTKFEDYWWYGRGNTGHNWEARLDNLPYINLVTENFPAVFKAGQNITSNVVNNISNEDLIKNVAIDSELNRTPDIVNGINITNLLDSGKVEKDLSLYLNGPDNQGMFAKNPNPNSPLFETRSQFIDQSKFFGSDYFYQKIGLDLTDIHTEFEQQNKRLVGDQFFQTKIIEEQLKTITKNSLLLSESEIDTNSEIKNLLDNAADEYVRLGLTANETLTQSQIDNLQKDIVWFETETINGELYVVPKIYLTKATRAKLKNDDSFSNKALMFAGADLELNSTDGIIKNGGSINARNDINISTSNNIINDNFSEINANGNLVLTSGAGSIINKSKLKSSGIMLISAANDVYNIASVETNDANLLNEFFGVDGQGNNISPYMKNNAAIRSSGNISSKLVENASISAGSLIISAGNDFNNYGANIESTSGDIDITAGDDINIGTVKLRNRRDFASRDHVSITDKTTNVGSEIVSAGNLTIDSNNNTLLKGSNILVAGNASVTTGNELNITSAQDSYYTYEASNKKKSFGRGKNSSSTTEIKTQVASNIVVGGDILLDGVSDVNIIASNLRGENGRIVSQAGNVNIKNGINSVKSYTTSKKKGSTAKSSSKVYDYQEVAAESSLAFNNDLKINAELGDVNIQGSTLDVNNDLSFGNFTIAQNPDGSLKTKADGTFETVSGDVVQNVNITAAELKSEHWEEHKSTSFNPINAVISSIGEIVDFVSLNPIADKLNKKLQEKLTNLVGADNKAMIEKTENKAGMSEKTSHSSNIYVGGNLNVNAEDGFKISGSNLNVGGDGNINATKVDIVSVAENSSSYKRDKSIKIGEVDARIESGSLKAGIKGTGEENLYQEEMLVQKSSNINIGNNLLINSKNNIDVVASNIAVGNDATIKTGGNFNLSDAKNTQKTNTENSKLEVEIGVKVGNAYVDSGYAAKALADAAKNLKKAEEKLGKMKSLKSEGRASQKAVDLAIAQVVLATAGVATATANLAMSAANAAQAASSSLGTGMYAAAYMDTSYHTDFLKTNSERSVGSSLIVGNNIDINANKNYNQIGSLFKSNNGNISIVANEANIKSGENTFQSEFGSKTTTASVSYGNNGVGLSAGYNQSDNFILQNTHTNSEILAEKGIFTLKTVGDTNIKGGNVTANQVALNIGGDLNLETLQDTYEQQGSSFGLSLGVGLDNPAVNNASISLGATEIFKKTTGKRTGIVELASNDNNLSEVENLTNLLASTSVNVAGNIDNQTVKKDIDFTNADFEGTLSVPVELFTESGRARMKDAFENFDKNIMTATTGAIFNATDSVAVAINKVTGKSEKGVVEDWKGARTKSTQGLKSYMENYDNRENLNQQGYDYYKSLTKQQIKDELIALPSDKSIYHTFQFDEQGNPINIASGGQKNYIKYIHPTKGYEIVVNNSNPDNPIIVTDPVNKGTYNHFSPGGLTSNVGHVMLDVLPYFVHGNDEKILPDSSTPTDSTWAIDRIGRTLYKPEK